MQASPFNSYYCNTSGKKSIDELIVKCSGCEWEGSVSMWLDHHLLNDCPFRNIKCEHCKEKMVYYEKESHEKKCKKILVPCPNSECSKQVLSRGLKKHLNTCPHTEVSCKFQKIGCNIKIKRKDVEEHERDNEVHVSPALETIALLEEKSSTLKNGESMVIKLIGYEEKRQNSELFTSTYFYTPSGTRMSIDMYANGHGKGNGTHVSVFVQANNGHNSETVTIRLLNQLANENHFVKVGRNLATFIPHSKLDHDPDKNTQYLKDDTLYFRVSIETPRPWLE